MITITNFAKLIVSNWKVVLALLAILLFSFLITIVVKRGAMLEQAERDKLTLRSQLLTSQSIGRANLHHEQGVTHLDSAAYWRNRYRLLEDSTSHKVKPLVKKRETYNRRVLTDSADSERKRFLAERYPDYYTH